MKRICISKQWYFSSPECSEQILLDLPHDYSIALPRAPKSAGGAGNGYFTGTSGKYVKYLHLGSEEHAILDIDGAYMCARVTLNENQLAMHPHGYTPFLVDLTPKMRKDRVNRLAITTQNVQPSTRWYSGAGVYRDVFLWTGGRVRIEPRDIFVTTQAADPQRATVCVAVEVTADMDAQITLKLLISSPSGQTAAETVTALAVKQGKNAIRQTYEIDIPRLWSTETPELYTLHAQIELDGKCEDVSELTFGIRTISADAEKGFLLNGQPLKLRGGCIHHDHGGLGAAAFPAAEYRKLSKLKEVGFNAVRIAHNPPSLALLEVCDRLGLLVMDEAFDMWNVPKNGLDYSLWFRDWWARDISYMVLRDRNHPCVISYSIGNEIVERNGLSDGAAWSRRLSDEIRKYDATRLVTSGVCGIWYCCDEDAPREYQEDFMLGYADVGEGEPGSSWAQRTKGYMEPLDIVGYNYLYERYAHDRSLFSQRVIWGSETHAINFYHSWKAVMENSHVIGDFTWTAYDNLGEAGTGRSAWARDGVITGISLAPYPWRSCYQGDFDLCGYRRPQSYFRESIWRADCEPKIFTTHPEHYGEGFSGTKWHWYDVLDSWTFADQYIGKPVKAEVYTDAEEIRFLLNGREVAAAKPVDGIASADILYEKGELTAVSYKNGKALKTSSLRTVGAPEKLRVVPEKTHFTADNRDLCYFEITVQDANGDRVPDADNELICACSGGELLAVFSGDPKNEDQYTSDRCHAFCGRAVAVVRAKQAGEVVLTVRGEGLQPDSACVQAEAL